MPSLHSRFSNFLCRDASAVVVNTPIDASVRYVSSTQVSPFTQNCSNFSLGPASLDNSVPPLQWKEESTSSATDSDDYSSSSTEGGIFADLDGCTPMAPFRMSSLLGTFLVQKNGFSRNTDKVLCNSVLVAIYYSCGTQSVVATEMIKLFAAGYQCATDIANELQALSIIVCSADKDEDFVTANIPTNWWNVPQSKSKEWKRLLRQKLNILNTKGPSLVIVDPMSGVIVSSGALSEIMELNVRNDVEYDVQAYRLYESWINKSGRYEQWESGLEQEVEFTISA